MNPERYINNWGRLYMDPDEKATRWVLAIVIVLVVFITSSAMWAETGIKDAQHRGPVPAKVTMLDDDLYLLHEGASVTASDICFDAASGEDPTLRNIRVERLNAALVQCYQDQEWNVHAGPDQSFIPDGAVHTATAPWFWGVLVGLLLIFFPYGYVRAARIISKRDKVEREAERKRIEEAKALLIAQWSRSGELDLDDPGYISDKDFEKRLGELDAKIAQA